MRVPKLRAIRIAGLCGLLVPAFVAWIGLNATDEPLSEEARAMMMRWPALPAASEDNGFIHFLGLSATGKPTYEAGLERAGR